MRGLARGGAVVASLAAFVAVLAWNVVGPGVRALLDAEAAGTLCAMSTAHLVGTVLAAASCGVALRWALGPSRAGQLGALALTVALLGLGGLTLEADSISSLGSFAANEACVAYAWRWPALLATFGLVAVTRRWPR